MSADQPDEPRGATGETEAAGDATVDPERVAALEAEVATLRERLAEATGESGEAPAADEGAEKRMTIVATKGTLDMAYPPLILASTAAAFGWDVVVFYTFWGLDVLHEEKSRNLKLSAVGNPNMPLPNAVAALPFMDSVATRLMERRIAENGTATIAELLDVSLETGVDLQACQMTMELMEYDDEAFHDGVTTGVGAATALQHMAEADVQLLV